MKFKLNYSIIIFAWFSVRRYRSFENRLHSNRGPNPLRVGSGRVERVQPVRQEQLLRRIQNRRSPVLRRRHFGRRDRRFGLGVASEEGVLGKRLHLLPPDRVPDLRRALRLVARPLQQILVRKLCHLVKIIVKHTHAFYLMTFSI